MNWHTGTGDVQAGIAIGVTLVCVKNWIVNEIGRRRTMEQITAIWEAQKEDRHS